MGHPCRGRWLRLCSALCMLLVGGVCDRQAVAEEQQPDGKDAVQAKVVSGHRGWRKTNVLPAAEAHQAAAASREKVFAVTSTGIAVYDRRTGERLGRTTGAAKHLNSGFLHEGRLYTAHSNYPARPEHSELRVLDPDSLELSVAHDFGDAGGSLTWAVFHQGSWWCNFARYGQSNAETFLARFDLQWRETGRWTYPEEVISQLGSFSLSGGLWHNGYLLVTGHDDPMVFRLQLPDEGRVLQYFDRQPVPFTGQGLAVDPLTNGLVGIDRARKQVVFAEPIPGGSRVIRVLTYNIHHAEGIDRKLDLARIAGVIRDSRADVVALQEVDRKTQRTDEVDQPEELARLTEMHVVFGGNITFEGGDYGNAVLSRFPIERHRNHQLPNLDQGEQRGGLEVGVKVPGAKAPLTLLATHLDHRRPDAERIASARRINQLISEQPGNSAILAGDLNAVPDSKPLEILREQWTSTSPREMPTVPVVRPARQIDYILVRPAGRWRVIETIVLREAVASDHRAVLSVLEWSPEEAP